MIRIILKIIQMYKVVNFSKEGDLIIKYSGSQIILSNRGDIIINSKRHTIHNRDLFFDGCDKEFIDTVIKENRKGKSHLKRYLLNNNKAVEYTNIKTNKNKEKEKVC